IVASISKLFVGVAILQLAEKGKLDLDEDINVYLRVKVNHPSGQKITARQLLKHRAGLRDDESGINKWRELGNKHYSTSLEEHTRDQLTPEGKYYESTIWSAAPPGGNYFYSNAGFTLLGYLIERASGESFYEYMENYIFSPLGIATATWMVPADTGNVAMPYSISRIPLGHYCVAQYPACQLRISITDLAKFLLFFTCGHVDGFKLLSEESVSIMCPANFCDSLAWWGQDASYGYSWKEVFIHGGFMSGVRTEINFYPKQKSGFIILTNGEVDYHNLVEVCEKIMQTL